MTDQPRRNSLLCPNCRRLVNRDAPQCPYCGSSRPGSWWKNSRLFSAFSDREQLVWMLIYTNIGMYLLSLLLNPQSANIALNPMSFLSPSNRGLLIIGSTGTIPIVEYHRWWSLISANFLHSSLLHLLFNMIALRQIAPVAINEYGGYRMLTIYLVGGVGGFFISFRAGIPLTLGASAAVCSLMGAMLYYGKSRGGVYGRNVYNQIGGWALSIFVFGLIVPGINNWAHGGGMASGALLGYLLGYQERTRENLRHKFLGIGCAVVTALVLIGAAVNAILYAFTA